MKRLHIITIFLFCLWAALSAQTTIMEHLQEERPDEGTIQINASPEINQLIGRKDLSLSFSDYIKISGHRIQFFSGNDRTAKAEALRRQALINEAFPETPTYVDYKAPYFRLRVGNFRTHEEAVLLRNQITKEIPSLKKESYIVKDEVQIPIN